MFMRLFMGKQRPNPLECAGTYQEGKKMMLFEARASKASRCFFVELTSKQKGEAVMLLTSEKRRLYKRSRLCRCKMIGFIVSELTALL